MHSIVLHACRRITAQLASTCCSSKQTLQLQAGVSAPTAAAFAGLASRGSISQSCQACTAHSALRQVRHSAGQTAQLWRVHTGTSACSHAHANAAQPYVQLSTAGAWRRNLHCSITSNGRRSHFRQTLQCDADALANASCLRKCTRVSTDASTTASSDTGPMAGMADTAAVLLQGVPGKRSASHSSTWHLQPTEQYIWSAAQQASCACSAAAGNTAQCVSSAATPPCQAALAAMTRDLAALPDVTSQGLERSERYAVGRDCQRRIEQLAFAALSWPAACDSDCAALVPFVHELWRTVAPRDAHINAQKDGSTGRQPMAQKGWVVVRRLLRTVWHPHVVAHMAAPVKGCTVPQTPHADNAHVYFTSLVSEQADMLACVTHTPCASGLGASAVGAFKFSVY